MEPFNFYPIVNANILTSMPASVLRNEGHRRAQEVKWSEELHFDGRQLEQQFNIFQSDKAILRSLRRGVGTTTLRMRPIGDKIVLSINRSLRVELCLPQTPRTLHLNADESILTDSQKRKRTHELLSLAGEGGYSEPLMPPFPGRPPAPPQQP